MRLRLIILLGLATLCILAFVISGCSQLSSAESTVEKKFSAMEPELTIRYNKLSEATTLMEKTGGKRDVVTDAKQSLKAYSTAKKKKDVNAELSAARKLETILGRLRTNAISSPKLSSSVEVSSSLDAVDSALPASLVRKAYADSVQSYESKRTSLRYLLSSLVGGYSSPEQLEFSLPPAPTAAK